MKRVLLIVLILMTATAAFAQYTKGQYLVCIKKGGVILRTGPSDSKPAAKMYDYDAVVFSPEDDIPDGMISNPDKGIKYLGKEENGFLYVEATRDGDIFDDVVIKAWIPKKYVKAACKKCNGLGYYWDDEPKACSKCRGKGY